MAPFGQTHSRPRDAFQSIIVSLYKFALVLTVHEELARALLRSTSKGLNLRKGFAGDERDHLIECLRRMYALWIAKLSEDPNTQKRCQPDPRLFGALLPKGALAGNAHFAKFVANMLEAEFERALRAQPAWRPVHPISNPGRLRCQPKQRAPPSTEDHLSSGSAGLHAPAELQSGSQQRGLRPSL